MRVYLAEKPAQQRDLVKVLGRGSDRGAPHGVDVVSDGWIVCAIGHLVTLEEPHEWDPELRRWSLENLPFVPGQWRKRAIAGKERQLEVVVSALRRASEIVICTDAGMEGELIAYELLERAGALEVPCLRLWVSALNAAALRAGFAALRPWSETRGYALAGEVRKRSDYLEGLNLSRCASLRAVRRKNDPVVSIGRVQTPALAMVVARERAIVGFEPKRSFVVEVTVRADDGREARLRSASGKGAFQDEAVAKRLVGVAKGARVRLGVREAEERKGPPRPLDLAALQAEGGKRFGWTVKRVLEVAQALYEKHQSISYPRTSARVYDSGDWAVAMEALARLRGLGGPWSGLVPEEEDVVRRDAVFDTAALEGEDHPALMTTPEAAVGLSGDEAALFEVVGRFFVAQFVADWHSVVTRVGIDVEGVGLEAVGRRTVTAGWRAVVSGSAEEEEKQEGGGREDEGTDLGEVRWRDGEEVEVVGAKVRSRSSRPPVRYSESQLVGLMKRAGIGTKSGWAQVVENLKDRGYVERRKGRLVACERGLRVVGWLEAWWPRVLSVEHTAELERRLEAVARGTEDADEVLGGLCEDVCEGVRALKRARRLDLISVEAGGDGWRGWRFVRGEGETGTWVLEGRFARGDAASEVKPGGRVSVGLRDGGTRSVALEAVLSRESEGEEVVVRAVPVASRGGGKGRAGAAVQEAGIWRFRSGRDARGATAWFAEGEFESSGMSREALAGSVIEVRRANGVARTVRVRKVVEWKASGDSVRVRVAL